MKKIILAFLLLYIVTLPACKDDFLEVKNNKKLIVPQKLGEIQALLDNEVMYTDAPYMAEVSSGDFWIEASRFQNITDVSKDSYLWKKNIYTGNSDHDWIYKYKQVFYANTALEAIDGLSPNELNEHAAMETKANALFYRAWAFFALAQTFCDTYKKASAHTDLGIPLRLATSISEKSTRATIAQTYEQIISDLTLAIPNLPRVPISKTRPSKTAANALLAKVHLIMQNYDQAYLNAVAALSIQNKLIDYNSVNSSAAFPFQIFNEEVVFHNRMLSSTVFSQSRLFIERGLYQSYQEHDLRKKLFFLASNGNYTFKGSYLGETAFFCGIATDELWLIKAEAAVRMGNMNEGITALNWLLKHRYAKGYFNDYWSANQEDALRFILKERRKELVFRGIRWSDLRRLNLDPLFQETLIRTMVGVAYKLEPNSKRYIFPFPDNVILLSGMPQNER